MKTTKLEKGLFTLIVDTREQENAHILSYAKANGIKTKHEKLDTGDYSFIYQFTDFSDCITIERKASLEEISGNLFHYRERFLNEHERYHGKIIWIIESGSWDDIYSKKYRTKANETSFAASMLSFRFRYNIDIQFTSCKHSGRHICNTLWYYLREAIKKNEKILD